MSKIIKETNIKCLIQGNINKKDAKDIYSLIYNKLSFIKLNNYKIKNIDEFKYIKLLNNGLLKEHYKDSLNDNDKNSSVFLFYQIGYIKPLKTKDWGKKLCLLKIINLILSESFFDILRSKEQLGYIVGSNIKIIGSNKLENIGYLFRVQSPIQTSEYIKNRIIKFVNNKFKDIMELRLEIFNNYINTIINSFMKSDKNINENFLFNIRQIASSNYVFNIKKLLIKEVKKITKKDVIKFYYDNFINNSKYKIVVIGINSKKK